MELKIVSKNADKFFDRTVVNFSVYSEPKETVKIEDVKNKLSEDFKEGFIVVYTMKNVYGKREATGIAHVYKNEDTAKKVLQKYVLKKNGVEYGKGKAKE
jgi:ribosomal protein S24E